MLHIISGGLGSKLHRLSRPRGKVIVLGFKVCDVLNDLRLCYTSLHIIDVLDKRNQFTVPCVFLYVITVL